MATKTKTAPSYLSEKDRKKIKRIATYVGGGLEFVSDNEGDYKTGGVEAIACILAGFLCTDMKLGAFEVGFARDALKLEGKEPWKKLESRLIALVEKSRREQAAQE